MHRFFVSHAKELTDTALEALKAALIEQLTTLANGQPFTVTLARDDWQAHFEKAGGWSEWIDHVVNGRDFTTNAPFYTGYVSAGRTLGKASAQILHGAFSAGKPVVVFEWNGSRWEMAAGRCVVKVRDNDWKTGWTIT